MAESWKIVKNPKLKIWQDFMNLEDKFDFQFGKNNKKFEDGTPKN